jgi:hypothetical protein
VAPTGGSFGHWRQLLLLAWDADTCSTAAAWKGTGSLRGCSIVPDLEQPGLLLLLSTVLLLLLLLSDLLLVLPVCRAAGSNESCMCCLHAGHVGSHWPQSCFQVDIAVIRPMVLESLLHVNGEALVLWLECTSEQAASSFLIEGAFLTLQS